MMGVPPGEADRLTYWKFTALRWQWNDRHPPPEGSEPLELPSEDFVRERQAELERLGISGRVH